MLRVRRPRLPARAAELPEQLLLPLDVRRGGARVHHSLSIYRAPVFPGVPGVITVHDVIPLMWPEHYLRTGLIHRMLYRAARRARVLLADSTAAADDVARQLGVDRDRILAVPLAADRRFAPTEPAPVVERLGIPRPYVLYVGGLSQSDPIKGVEELIAAFGRWARELGRPEALVLTGKLGPAGAELRALATRSGARVAFTGFVSEEDLPALYTGAACFVTASRYEGFGLPLLEAIACGTPVAAYAASAVPEVAGPGALLVPEGNTGELMRAVGSLCDEPELRGRLAEEGRRHAAGFSWRRTAELTWDAYERAAA